VCTRALDEFVTNQEKAQDLAGQTFVGAFLLLLLGRFLFSAIVWNIWADINDTPIIPWTSRAVVRICSKPASVDQFFSVRIMICHQESFGCLLLFVKYEMIRGWRATWPLFFLSMDVNSGGPIIFEGDGKLLFTGSSTACFEAKHHYQQYQPH
jgi:hypothetical protein